MVSRNLAIRHGGMFLREYAGPGGHDAGLTTVWQLARRRHAPQSLMRAETSICRRADWVFLFNTSLVGRCSYPAAESTSAAASSMRPVTMHARSVPARTAARLRRRKGLTKAEIKALDKQERLEAEARSGAKAKKKNNY